MSALRFTKHAETAIRERRLERSWIEQAVRQPDWTEPDPVQPEVERRFLAIAELGKVLRVAVVQTANETRILTAFFDRDARQK